jgi:hypothetical protein
VDEASDDLMVSADGLQVGLFDSGSDQIAVDGVKVYLRASGVWFLPKWH